MSNPARLAIVHRRSAVVAWAIAVLAGAAVVALAGWAIAAAHEKPTLDASGGPLAEALQWPWPDFPGVAEIERQTIRRQFQLDEPLFAERLLPWTRVPDSGPMRPASGATRRELDAVLVNFSALSDPRRPSLDDPYALDGDGGAEKLARMVAALHRVPGAEDSWLVAYDSGVVNLWRGATRQAERDLERARELLARELTRPPTRARDLAQLYSAAVHTEYALGHALLAGGEGEPEAVAAARRARAIGAFRLATQWTVAVIKRAGEAYPEVVNELSFFELRETGLSTGVVTNDLVAAYLAAAGYHDCEEPPQAWPCEPMPSPRATCAYRDRSFCKSLLDRSGEPFGPPFSDLMERFYDGQAWGDEHRLWALSNAVDRTAENLDLGDPYLLYNFATLLIERGDFASAAEYLDAAQLAFDETVPDHELERMTRLATVSRVLAGRSPRGGREQARTSTLRQRYRALYGERTDLPVTEFPPVGTAFEPNAEALIDRWLFLQLWRAQLARGDLAGFEREYRRVAGREDLPGDFFAGWRNEVTGEMGRRALARADAFEADGEHDQARRIRHFVAESGHFPATVASEARGFGGWLVWALRRAATPLTVAAALLVLTLIAAYTVGLVRAHRALFLSAHRRDRLHGSTGS